MPKATRLCDVDGCDRTHVAKGMCSHHYRKANPPKKDKPVACPQCGAITLRRDAKRSEAKVASGFCSLICRDVWRLESGHNPAPPNRKAKRVSRLPIDHPVRVLMRAPTRGPIRSAFEDERWSDLLAALRAECVEVDECWLWSRQTAKGYGKVNIGKRVWSVHRLALLAHLDGELDPAMPVHHACAERLCCNPRHLASVTQAENTAEMLERRFYLRRIAELEEALATASPEHPLIQRRRPSAVA